MINLQVAAKFCAVMTLNLLKKDNIRDGPPVDDPTVPKDHRPL